MAVRTERRYSSTNRSIIHRRYGVALSYDRGDRRCNYHEVAFIVLRPFDALKVNSLFTGPSVLGIDHRSPLTSSVKRKGGNLRRYRHRSDTYFHVGGIPLFRETLENCA
ncbi:uncharacterized protein LOC116185632 [Apis dorsata]|uniref:uncharacterized protein LOC116185632 n=1 Tax=Apis dorsata TaxID=7462 RepID=UPI001293C152|nr:uncharacterized protein LOC116185632 [Apis dorsata]